MTNHEVNIAALAAFAEALRAYPSRQAATLDAADRAIERTRAALEATEYHWRHEVERCRAQASACFTQAAFAASEGMYVNCAPYEHALYAAEERLRRVVEAQYRFDTVVSWYRSASLRYGAILEDGLPRAVTYLDTCIDLYSAVAATPLHTHPALNANLRESAPPGPSTDSPPTDGGPPRSGSSPERSESAERREGGPEQRG